MSQIQRISRFVRDQAIPADQLENEILNIITNWNNHDQGTFTWGNVKVTTLTATTATITTLTAAGNIAMGGFKLTGLGAGSGAGDSLRYEQLIGLYLLLTGGTMSGPIAMGTNKITGLGNGTAAQDAAAFGQVKLLQTVQNTITGAISTTSTTFVDTGLSVTITPTSVSNRILLTAYGTGQITGLLGSSVFFTLANGTTNLLGATGGVQIVTDVASQAMAVPVALGFVDSPATTSAITYKVRFAVDAGTTTAFFGQSASQKQIMIAQEVV